ncbi:two-component regulator propeller domain-containing protein [Massilibacteroides sp.]|uniref:ligand-binding sensor domain-containing protein n=1 Tax=Massilibacteroides sp. TaxID=2034766 RepID=UPI002613380A|nr:two-component regulator propeller domain-containing protein [Massilibacteroides sp.]MDD4514621.1 two-component regulator propeller domain-containing protein [Massilibacteroides sp.]
MNKRVLYIIALFITLNLSVKADENFFFSHLGVEDGLSQISVLKIFQDSDGYLWFGTRSGLNRYDGYEFKIFRNEANNTNTLSDRYIYDINEDKEKNIWVATPNGLNCIAYQTGKISYFYPKEIDSLSTTNSSDYLLHHTDGNIYMLQSSKVFLCNSDKTVCFHKRLSPTFRTCSAVAQDAISGNIYIGTRSRELLVYSEKWELKNIISLKNNKLPDSYITSILPDKEVIWLGTEDKGICSLDKNTGNIKSYNTNNSALGNNTIRSLIFLNNDSLLIGTFGGLNILNKRNNQITPLSVNLEAQGNLSHYSVHSMLLDKDKTLWIGTYSAGINYHSPYYKQITYITPKMYTGIMGKGVQDKNGNLWFATEGRGLFYFNPRTNEQKVYPLTPLHHSNYERNIIKNLLMPEGSDEILCTTHFGSVYSFSITKKEFRLLYDYKENDIYSLYIDSHKRLWIPLMTSPGLLVEENGKLKNIFSINGQNRAFNQITVIEEIRDNQFLMGGLEISKFVDPVN